MQKSRLRILEFLGILIILTSCSERQQLGEFLAKAEHGEPKKEIRAIVSQITQNTQFHNSWVINPTKPAPASLNLFFLPASTNWQALARADRRLLAIKDNCCVLPGESTIACDSEFPRRFLEKYDLREDHYKALMLWILGHELGHIANDSGGVHLALPSERRPSRTNLASQRNEYAADCWMSRHLLEVATLDQRYAIESLAVDLINARFRAVDKDLPAGAGIIFDYTRLDPYDFRGFESHPDMLLRAIRILHTNASIDDRSNLLPMINPVIRKIVPDPLWTNGDPCGVAVH